MSSCIRVCPTLGGSSTPPQLPKMIDNFFVSIVYKLDFKGVLGMISKSEFLCTTLNSPTWIVVGTALEGKHFFPTVSVNFVGISTLN